MENLIMTSITTSLHANHLLFLIFLLHGAATWPHTVFSAAPKTELLVGFEASPDPSLQSFQPLLNDPAANFSFGFLRLHETQLALAVVHLRSVQPLWAANPTTWARWSDRTRLIFNGSLVISDSHSGAFWSTGTNGDRVVLLNTSNLQIQKIVEAKMEASSASVVWQSFEYPSNAIVENQNFTSNMSLNSSNGRYSMRLGYDFMALYAKFQQNAAQQMYWKHKALEVKAQIIQGKGPIQARVHSDGFLGMFQIGDTPVDVQAFSTFNRPNDGFLFVRLEDDGDLKGYFWDGANWVLDYQAILNTCELPSPCGSYGLCGAGSSCSCLDNRTDYRSTQCSSVQSGDLCESDGGDGEFWVLRRKGVELPFKELMSYSVMSSLDQCESSCESNCSCWGAVYNNGSGFCYTINYPIQTLLDVRDESKLGYFKVKKEANKKMGLGYRIGLGVLGGAMLGLVGATAVGGYRMWRRRRGVREVLEGADGLSAGPYKDLGSASFRSIEMADRKR